MIYDEKYFVSDEVQNDYGPDLPYDWEHRQGQMKATVWDMERLCLPFKTVLDVGCGTGLLVRALVEAEYEAQGVDISTWAIDNADSTVSGRVHVGDTRDLQVFEPQSYDLVAAMDLLEHLAPEDVPLAMTEIMRVADREVIFRLPCARDLEWLTNPDPKALASPTGDDSHTMVVPPQYWEWEIQRQGWLLSSRVHNFNLGMLPRVTYFVARRPKYRHRDRDYKEDK